MNIFEVLGPALRPRERALAEALVDARRVLDESAPLWPDNKIPTRRHRRQDCSRMSADEKTKIVAHPFSSSPWHTEVCPCGAVRVLLGGKPHGGWQFRNKAFDPTWFTRRDRPWHQVPCNPAASAATADDVDARRRHLAEGQST